jgi:hemerythrin
MFEWTQELAVGVPYIDEQHQDLFRYAEELYAAMAGGQGKAVLARTLERLIDYTRLHFAAEERLMRVREYPGAMAHKAEHQALAQRVMDFAADYKTGQAVVTEELMQFLRSWLETHIKQSDMQFAAFLKAGAPP